MGRALAAVLVLTAPACDGDPTAPLSEVMVGPEITEPTTLGSDRIHRISGELLVRSELRIEPGTEIRLEPGAGISVEGSAGSIQALGTATNPIRFVGTEASAGWWRSIKFDWSSRSNALVHVEILHGGAEGAAVEVAREARLRLEHARIASSGGYGVIVRGDGDFTGFASNVFEPGAAPPLRLPAHAVPHLDHETVYAGGGRDGHALVEVTGGGLGRAGTWRNLPDASYRIVHPLTFQRAITIEPGTTLVFAEGAGLRFQALGSLTAVGSADAPILFAGEEPVAGSWRGLEFAYRSGDSALEFVEVRHAGSRTGAVSVTDDGRVALRSSTILESGGYGLHLDPESTLTGFGANTFTANAAAPVRIPASQVHRLDGLTRFAGGNGGGERELVEVYQELHGVLSEATWPALLDAAYLVTRDLTVGAALTLEPGVELRFAEGRAMTVEWGGTLTARGTADAPIRLLGHEERPGSWVGVRIRSGSTRNVLDHVEVAHGGRDHGNIRVSLFPGDQARVQVSNALIRDAGGYGVFITAGTYIEGPNVEYRDNGAGDVRTPE
jgi:hypothetical protein